MREKRIGWSGPEKNTENSKRAAIFLINISNFLLLSKILFSK